VAPLAQSLCSLRDHCRQWPRNTRYQADATPCLDRTFTGWIAPALRLAHRLDHLVSEREQRRWDCDTERFGGLEVYDEVNLSRLLDWQVNRPLPIENWVANAFGELTSLGEELHEKVDSVSGTKRNQVWDEAAIGFRAPQFQGQVRVLAHSRPRECAYCSPS